MTDVPATLATVTLNSIFGPMIAFERDHATTQIKAFGAHTRNEVAALCSAVDTGDLVYDIGAHIGTFAIPLARAAGQCGRVIAIEADIHNFSLLTQNIDLNGLTGRIVPIHGLVGGDGVAYRATRVGEHSSATYFTADPNGEVLPCLQVDALHERLGDGGRVRIIKIDVEGMELSVLRSAERTILRDRPILYLEISADQLARYGAVPHDIEAYLRGHNYRFFRNAGERNSSNDAFELVEIASLRGGAPLYDVLAIPADDDRLASVAKTDGAAASRPSPSQTRRAVVWLCWGEAFVRDAITSARSARGIAADRFLITDATGASCAGDSGDFTRVIAIETAYRNNLEKSRLVDLLPEGYDTFLFLDTDTRVVSDVSYGFDKAEQHGVAIASAPNYNLGEYFGFAAIMADAGIVPADQLMFNSGVIFFHLTPRVHQVLARWRDLCVEFGVKHRLPRDQPFLTLAFEQLGFTPYVLSPLYNYRGLGEFAVGQVRIWHSRHSPPSDLNAFDVAWPARRFRDGKRVIAEADPPAPTLAPPAPQAMLRHTFARLSRQHGHSAPSLAAYALAIESQRGSRAASEFLIKLIGLRASSGRDESYYSESLHYLLGLVLAHDAEPELMAPHFVLSRTMPSGDDDQLFSDHVNQSRFIRTVQLKAIARGLPPILMACMPRSASASLTHSLANTLDLPVMHLSVGDFPHRFLVPSWLDMFLEGGAITQDHFGPNDFNLGVLRGRGSRDMFVLIRDPRAAARSQARYLQGESGDSREPLDAAIERECLDNFIPWLQGWLDCAKDPNTPFRIHLIPYEEVCIDMSAVLKKIGAILCESYPAMAAYASLPTIAEVTIHFENGNDNAWKLDVGKETRNRLWDACSPEIRSLLRLHW